MKCSNSTTYKEPVQCKTIAEQIVVKKAKEEKSISFDGFSKEESKIVQSLLSENKYEPNDVLGYKAEIEFNYNNSYYSEYLILQTGKKEGKKYSGKYKFTSKIVQGKNLKSNVFLNKTSIESVRVKENENDDDFLEIEIDYSLNETDNSFIIIMIKTESKPKFIIRENEVHYQVIHFGSYPNSFFKINIKWSDYFYFFNTRHNTKNKFELISPYELVLSGTELEENSFHFRFDFGSPGYELNNNTKYFYNCNEEELHSLQLALNSVGLIFLDVNIFGIKDIFNIWSTRGCEAKTFIYFIYPTETNTDTSANFLFELEQNSVKLIKSKINNEDDDRSKVVKMGNFDLINIYFHLKNEQFCVVELDYTFELKKISDINPKFDYNLCINHKNLLIGGFYSCEINMEYQDMFEIKSNGLFIDKVDKNENCMKLRYNGYKTGNPLVMLNLPYGK